MRWMRTGGEGGRGGLEAIVKLLGALHGAAKRLKIGRGAVLCFSPWPGESVPEGDL